MQTHSSTVPPSAIHVRGLVKRFGPNEALAGIDLTVPRGSIHALLGPNGSGKTTTVRILTTLLRPTTGTVRVMGFDVGADADAVRSSISLTGQFASQDDDLTGFENLTLIARLSGFGRRAARERANTLLAAFDLADAAGRQVAHYSGGMRRRLDIAASLIVRPEILVLDEPTTGLDPRSRNSVWEVVRSLAAMGTTILLTTQYLEEADRLADRITLLNGGRVVAEGTSEELKALSGAGVLTVRVLDEAFRASARSALLDTVDEDDVLPSDGETIKVSVGGGDAAARVLARLADRDIALRDFAFGGPTLDEAFLELTGRPDGDAAGVAAR